MKSLLKATGRGLLYLITLPCLLVMVSLLAVVGIFYFIFLGIKAIVLFFKGKSLFNDLPEDQEVQRIKAASIPPAEEKENEIQNTESIYIDSSQTYNYMNQMYQNETHDESEKKDEIDNHD